LCRSKTASGSPRCRFVERLRLCQRDAKTADHFFSASILLEHRVLYLYALKTALDQRLLIIALSIWLRADALFTPAVRRACSQTNILGAIWGATVLYLIYRLPAPPLWLLLASLLFPAYYTILSLWLELRRILAHDISPT
jgi:phosphatidylcholine synthase